MKILISGATGFIGSALVPHLTQQGHSIVELVRKTPTDSRATISWSPAVGRLASAPLEGFDAVIHLAGEPIAKGRWTAQKKARIRQSRLQGTQLLVEKLTSLKQPPKQLLCASAVGVYGNRGDEVLTEESAYGTGFLAEVGQAWEQTCKPAQEKGIQVTHMRFGIILDPSGGALAKMAPPFRLGVGGPLGPGTQWMSWIVLEDVVRAIEHILNSETLQGPVNLVAPEPVTNQQFSMALGAALSRPVIFSVPAFALKLLVGGMAEEALLASCRVQPTQLHTSGFSFQYPDIQSALTHLLGRR